MCARSRIAEPGHEANCFWLNQFHLNMGDYINKGAHGQIFENVYSTVLQLAVIFTKLAGREDAGD